jgi:hypothetical protein
LKSIQEQIATKKEESSSNRLKGKKLFPHDIVREFLAACGLYCRDRDDDSSDDTDMMSSAEADLLYAQWIDIRQKVLADITAALSPPINPLAAAIASTSLSSSNSGGDSKSSGSGSGLKVDLRKFVPLVDVSGSMEGTPMEVAIALGILISEINQPQFRDRLLTFTSDPSWVDLSGLTHIRDKVKKTRAAPWGTSTNFYKAIRLIADVIAENKLPMEEIPDLVVFSDMQFDAASEGRFSGGNHSMLDDITSLFHDIGMEVCGKPYPIPRIVFWNLRGDTRGFPATAQHDNVAMLSGFSPSLFKAFMEGGDILEGTEKEHGSRSRANIDPYQTFRKVIDNERYDAVRLILSKSTEDYLCRYQFTPTASTEHSAPVDSRDADPSPSNKKMRA